MNTASAINKEAISKKEKDVKNYELQEQADLKFVLASAQGRRILWKYLSVSGVYEQSFTGNSTTFFNEGRRSIGLLILADIMEANPESYLQMMMESKGDDQNGR